MMGTKRQVLMATGLVALSIGCKSKTPEAPAAAAPVDYKGPRLYVSNEVSGDLTIIDATTAQVISTVALGQRPRGIHPSPDGKTIYVAVSGSPIGGPNVDESKLPPADHSKDGIAVFDVASSKVTKIMKAGNDPENFAVSLDGKEIYVSNEDDSQVSIIDVDAGEIKKSFKMGAQPEGVQMTPDGKLVYVTSEEDGNVSVLDPAAGKIMATIKVGHRPRNVAFMPGGKKAYVNAENDGNVDVIDTVKHKIGKPINLGKPGVIKPMDVIVSADGSKLYVSTGRGKQVFTVDTATDKPVSSVEVGARPWGIVLSADGKTLYSANGSSNDVSFVDLATNSVTKKVKAGTGPWGVIVLDHP